MDAQAIKNLGGALQIIGVVIGGIADVLEEKSRRGILDHLGKLRDVWVYRNDRQIKVSYRQLDASDASYTVRIRELSNPAGL
jgi:hypothetical protein